MKQKLLLKTLLLLCALVAGSSSVWAEEVVHYTLDGTKTGGTNSYGSASDITQNNMDWKVTANTTQNPWRIGGSSITNEDRPIYSTTAMGSAITKIEISTGAASSITVNSVKLIVSTVSNGGGTKIDEITKTSNLAPNKTITFTPTSPLTEWATGAYYKIIFNVTVSGSSNKFVAFNSAKFYKEKIEITNISLPSTESVGVGGTVTLTPTITPANYTSTVEWSSDDETVATVTSAGVVSGVAAGTATITAKSSDNATIKAECTVTVTAPIAVTGVSLNKTSLDMHFGDTETLNPTIAPATATNKAVSWESDDTKVATVTSDGLVTAVGPGTCTITVTTDDGDFTATCDVTVSIASVDLSAPKVISNWDAVSASYYTTDTYLNIEGYTFKLKQCCRQTTLQFKESVGELTSPTINSTNGYTVIIETATGSNNSGKLTLKIGSDDAVTVTGPNKTVMATTSSTSTSFTIKNLNSGAMKLGKITIVPNQYSTTVQSYGWATFIAPAPVQFASNTAYVVTDASVSGSSGSLSMAAVTQVPKDTPVLLKGAGTKDITVIASASAPATNLLSIGTGTTPAGKYPYVLAKDGEGACFKQWTGTAATLNGRVVLLLDESIATAPVFTLDSNETTGIDSIENGKLKIENSEVYNLAGQRVANPTKGLYIVNGKKVIIK